MSQTFDILYEGNLVLTVDVNLELPDWQLSGINESVIYWWLWDCAEGGLEMDCDLGPSENGVPYIAQGCKVVWWDG